MYRSHAGDMGLVSLVACHLQVLGLSTRFNGCVGREIEEGPVDHSVGLRGGVGSTFS
jgi:hypothetical protein